MARTDGDRGLEELYRVLMDRQFDFVPRGEQYLQNVYRAVRDMYAALCDDSYLCSACCKSGTDSPEWHHVVRAVLKNVRARGGPVTKGPTHGRWIFGPLDNAAPLLAMSTAEGRQLLQTHKVTERDWAIVRAKKQSVLAATGRLACEACRFDFGTAYGQSGRGFAECHHRLPFSAAAGERRTELADLAVVCANCHRMLHRRPWRTVEELRELIRSRQPLAV